MNILKKYKSNTIAVVVSFAFYGILFLLLTFMPGLDSSLNVDDLKIQDEPIQLQMMEDMTPPSPTEAQTPEDKRTNPQPTEKSIEKTIEKLTKGIESKDVTTDDSKDIDQGPDETNVVQNQDSVIYEQLKKSLAVFKEIVPADSLEKNPIQQKAEQKLSKALAEKTSTSAEEWEFIRSNYRTIQNIRRVYPYVMKTKEVVERLNTQLATVSSNKEKHRLIKETEKELFKSFEKDVRNMSYSQGKLLLKLIARETNQSAYGLIKTYKGGIPATFWYGVGLLFKENLKTKYDSLGEDALLEKVILKHKLGKF
ncbi:MAG TPA: DUF4294 domain-containing protein [Paludibacter sp.]|nr:DUF4294 domain-containing protein [Paludibacter sp.]